MARIRTIKPELFTDPDLAQCSLGARWLFAGLFTEADDKGRIIDSPKRIAGAVFPHDEKITAGKVKAWLDELADIDCIRRYDSNNQHLIWLPNFTTHQKISKPTPSKLPPHPDDKDEDESGIPPDPPPGNSGESHGEKPIGSGSRKLEVEVGSGSSSSSVSEEPHGEPPQDDDDGPPRWAFIEAERQADEPRRPGVEPIHDRQAWVLKAARRVWHQRGAQVAGWLVATPGLTADDIAERLARPPTEPENLLDRLRRLEAEGA